MSFMVFFFLWIETTQSSRKTFLAISSVELVTDQAHLSETKSTSPIRLVAGNIHQSAQISLLVKHKDAFTCLKKILNIC